ncbi:hypothetical protein [Chthonobacter rhizosphaerae]|uniref:hypothetical protein n=1 Tax=Chthonobacter rhizosphaerae TaxID=2735553 RepID=UPI0015EFCC10|nr:hypothetical protein [Chthonobacter rhizosphaerae]
MGTLLRTVSVPLLRGKSRFAVAGLVLALAACGGGPSDYVQTTLPVADPAASAVPLRSETQQAALERDLKRLGSAQASAGRRADDKLPSAMALAIIRQQQNEEARKLLDAAGTVPPAGAQPCDPKLVVCPDKPAP